MTLKVLLLLCMLAAGGCGVLSSHIQVAAEKEVKTEEGAKPTATGTYWLQSDGLDNNLLFQAEQDNDVQETQKLLKSGADPNQDLVDSNKVIDFAATDGHVALVRLLIRSMPQLSPSEAKANLQKAENAALALAVTSGTIDTVKALLEQGADVNSDGNTGDGVGSPLMRATARGSLSLMHLLLVHKAQVNQQDIYGRTALMFVGVVNMYYSPYNEEPDDNVPAARLTARPAKLLLQYGAKVNLRDRSGKTALMWASQGNPQVVSLLLANGAHIDARDKVGRTALLCASSVRDPLSMMRLLEAGASVDAQDKDGKTPLMCASVQPDPPADTKDTANRRKAIALLVRYGANLLLRDKQHRTAADYVKMSDTDFISAS